MGKYVVIAVLLVLLGLTVWWSVAVWNSESDVQMSGHGYVAMALGIVFSLAVGIGLMALLFYSSRKGYDEPAERERQRPND